MPRQRTDEPGRLDARVVANGAGWSVKDIVCSCGPQDRRFEEQHDRFVIAIVTSGTFQYRGSGSNGEQLMTPGSLLLGSPGQCFECGHEHGVGDRCLAFQFTADYFNGLAADRDVGKPARAFRSLKISPLRALSPIVAEADAALSGASELAWQEFGICLAARALQMDDGNQPTDGGSSPAAIARVTDSVRSIEAQSTLDRALVDLAQEAGLSPFHYLRMFESVTGTTPHQFLLRTRLRKAAVRLSREDTKVVDIALDTGFGDVSNFNRAFRAEFGVTPTRYRQRHCGPCPVRSVRL